MQSGAISGPLLGSGTGGWTTGSKQCVELSQEGSASARRCEMPRQIGEDERLTEDESARRRLGPRGVPGGPDTAKMTPQQQKNIPKTGDFDGHTA
jgi:hypothetical protein